MEGNDSPANEEKYCPVEDEELPVAKLKRMKTEQELMEHFNDHANQSERTLIAEFAGQGNILTDYVMGYIRDPKRIARAILYEFTIIQVISTYHYSYLLPDFVAGFCEGIVAVPQGLSYAALAGLPPVFGLYMCMINPAIYLIFGQSKQGSHGTAAIEALIVWEAVHSVVGPAPSNPGKKAAKALITAYNQKLAIYQARYNRCATCTTMVAGILQLILRVLSLGNVADMLSHPVLCGFSTGAAVVIASSQLKNLWSINLPSINNSVSLWIMVCQQWHQGGLLNWYTFAFCLCGYVFIHLIQFVNNSNKYTKKFPLPGPLLLIIFSVLICRHAHLYVGGGTKYGVPVVKTIQQGFPKGTVPRLSEFGLDLIGPGMKCGLLNYIMSQAFAKAMANIHGYEVTGNNEVGSLAVMNIFSSFFSCYPCALSLSRTALVNGLGTKTQFHCLVCSMVQVVVIGKLTKPLYFLPKCILTAIIFFALDKMIMLKEGKEFLLKRKLDFFFFFLTLIVTIVCGGVVGICTGIGTTFVWLIYTTAYPNCTVMGRIPETDTAIYRCLNKFPFCETYPGIQIVGFTAPLHFGNQTTFRDKMLDLEQAQFIIFDAYSVYTIDCAGVEVLIEVAQILKERGTSLLIGNWHAPERFLVEKYKLYDHISRKHVFLTLHDAVMFARESVRSDSKEVQVSINSDDNQAPTTDVQA